MASDAYHCQKNEGMDKMGNYPAYSEKDHKKSLNWLRNLLHSSSPRSPAITVSRSFPKQGNYDVTA